MSKFVNTGNFLALLLLSLIAALQQPAVAATSPLLFQAEQKFTPPAAAGGDRYGTAVAIDGKWMVVGAPHKADAGTGNAGVVYIYERQDDYTWELHQQLTMGDVSGYSSQTGAEFGDAVAISGDIIVIGAPGYDDPIETQDYEVGAAVVFVRNSGCTTSFCWSPLQLLNAGPYRNSGDRFGDAVDIDVNMIAVGAPLDEGGGALSDRGAVYVYQGSGSTLSLVARVASNTTYSTVAGSNDQFGSSVALRGGALAVGAPGDDDYAADAGAVYLYDAFLGWSLYQKILGQAVTEWFGRDVDIDPWSFRMVASAHRALANGVTYGGVVRIYTGAWLGGWSQTGTLTPSGADNTTPDSTYYGYFGNSVAFEKATNGYEYILVGAVRNKSSPGDPCTPVCSGAAYVFEDQFDGSGPVQIRKLAASDGAPAEYYGEEVALDDYTAVVGAPRQPTGTESGAAYVYSTRASTYITLKIDPHAVQVNNQQVVPEDVILHVGGVPAPNAVLAGHTINLTITAPSGAYLPLTGVTGTTGRASFPALGPFTELGTYTIKAEFAGTTNWSPAVAPVENVLVSNHSGYVVIIEGAVTPEGDQDELPLYKTASRVYQAALARGFSDDRIFFFAPGYPYGGRSELDGAPTDYPYLLENNGGNDSLFERLSSATDQGPVHFILIGHGGIDSADETGQLYLHQDQATSAVNVLKPAQLENLLEQLEAIPGVTDWPRTVTVLSCFSGSFMRDLAHPWVPGRVLVSSARANEEAFRGLQESDGIRSGSYFGDELFDELLSGESFGDAFTAAEHRTESYTRADDGSLQAANQNGDPARQHPLLDDNDNVGSNQLSEGLFLDGWLARNVYFGTGQERGGYDPFTVDPTLYLAGPGTQCLTLSPGGHTAFVAANVAIRGPGTTLPAPSGQTGQLEPAYSYAAMTALPGGDFEYCPNFNMSGRWDVWLFGEDAFGKHYESKHVVVYVDGPANIPPGTVTLLSPPDGSVDGRTNQAFDWDPVTDPDGDAVSYRLQIATDGTPDANGLLLQQYMQYEIDGLRSSRAHVDVRAGLEDLKTYYWQVLAVDRYGKQQHSAIWSFTPNNKNFVGTRLVGKVSAHSVGVEGAVVTLAPHSRPTDENGEYQIDDAPLGLGAATADYAGYNQASAVVDMYPYRDTPWSPELAQGCSVQLTPSANNNVDEAGGPFQLAVNDGGTCAWDAVSNSPAWLSVTDVDQTNDVVSYSVTRNESIAAGRYGTLTIGSQSFIVTQLAALDSDGDGISDYAEASQYGTNPDLWDTDGDGLSDGEEINQYGTSPLLQDSDGDYYDDYFEVNDPGSNPVQFDPTWGDIDGNRQVNVLDVQLAARSALELYSPGPGGLLRGNIAPLVNGVPAPAAGDTVIDGADFYLIQRKAAGAATF